jgi:hypothetical protein
MKNPIYDQHLHTSTPSAPVNNIPVQYFKSTYEADNIREYLSAYPNNWPRGLQESLMNNLYKIPYRFFICDDSGSVSSELPKFIIFSYKVFCFNNMKLDEYE